MYRSKLFFKFVQRLVLGLWNKKEHQYERNGTYLVSVKKKKEKKRYMCRINKLKIKLDTQPKRINTPQSIFAKTSKNVRETTKFAAQFPTVATVIILPRNFNGKISDSYFNYSGIK
jgi:hypothetical protein